MIPAANFMVIVGRHRFPAAYLREASILFRLARDQFGEGADLTPVPEIADTTGKIVAHISYNGRVWCGPKGSWSAGDVPLCCPT